MYIRELYQVHAIVDREHITAFYCMTSISSPHAASVHKKKGSCCQQHSLTSLRALMWRDRRCSCGAESCRAAHCLGALVLPGPWDSSAAMLDAPKPYIKLSAHIAPAADSSAGAREFCK